MDAKAVAYACHVGWEENRLGVENYPKKCIEILLPYLKNRSTQYALDVGCGIGRSSFELARVFDDVTGIDPSVYLIREAVRLKESGRLRYALPEEGELTREYRIELKDFGLVHASKKVNFWQADIGSLKPVFTGYDLIVALQLLERISDPMQFLQSVAARIRENGLLVLTSAYAWSEEITPKNGWLGGFMRNGKRVKTFETITEILNEAFQLIERKEIPVAVQKSDRTYLYEITEMSIWERQ
jgi:putative 4-mercaptohistidine N1-methyltranferase